MSLSKICNSNYKLYVCKWILLTVECDQYKLLIWFIQRYMFPWVKIKNIRVNAKLSIRYFNNIPAHFHGHPLSISHEFINNGTDSPTTSTLVFW